MKKQNLTIIPLCQLVYVIVKPENRTSKQERLPDVEQKTRRYIGYLCHLVAYHHDSGHYQKYGTAVLYGLVRSHIKAGS